MQSYGRRRTPPESLNFSKSYGRFHTSSSQNSYMQTPGLSNDETEVDERSSASASQSPSRRMLPDEYTNTAVPRREPIISQRSSTYNDDPVITHLLIETAIGDSQNCKVLSYEELHDLKKEQNLMSRRIQGVRRNLNLETRVRNAAQSLSRLHSKAAKTGGQNGGSSFASSHSSTTSQTDDELANSTQKCETMTQDLRMLEKRLAQLHDRQMQHTAGILYMEHSSRSQQNSQLSQCGESHDRSMSNGFNYGLDEKDMPPEELLNMLDGTNSKNAKIREELIYSTEKRLQKLHDRLRNTVALATPDPPNGQRSVSNEVPPLPKAITLSESLDTFESHFSVLEEKIQTQRAKASVDAIEARVQTLNNQLYELLQSSSIQRGQPYPPPTGGESLESDVAYLEGVIGAVRKLQNELTNGLEETTNREKSLQDGKQQTATVLQGLWEVIKTSEHDRRRKRLAVRSADGETFPKDVSVVDEEFTIQTFSTKVQHLCTQSSELLDQQIVLREHIDQQREANSGTDSERSKLLGQLQDARDQHLAEQKRHQDSKAELDSATADFAQAQQEIEFHKEQRAADESSRDQRAEMLQQELTGLLAGYEGLVKQGVEAEREREKLESTVDALREKMEELDLQVAEGKVRSMGRRASGVSSVNGANGAAPTAAREATSMNVMRTEFKKMMRDAKAEHFRHMKLEADERRRLEATIRALRKEQVTAFAPATLNGAGASITNGSDVNGANGITQTQTHAPLGKSGLSNSIIADGT